MVQELSLPPEPKALIPPGYLVYIREPKDPQNQKTGISTSQPSICRLYTSFPSFLKEVLSAKQQIQHHMLHFIVSLIFSDTVLQSLPDIHELDMSHGKT